MSNTWDKEDEYEEEYGEANGFGAVADSNSTANLPQGVTDRLDKYAERTNKKLADAITEFLGDIKDNYACDAPSQEDDDLLVDWAEQFILETRKQSSGSNSKLQTWVGCFLGMHDKKSDRLANIVRANLKLYKDDPNEAVYEDVRRRRQQWEEENGRKVNWPGMYVPHMGIEPDPELMRIAEDWDENYDHPGGDDHLESLGIRNQISNAMYEISEPEFAAFHEQRMGQQ